MKKIITGIVLVVCAFGLVGCEMMKGAGKDIQEGGKQIEKAASDK